MLDIDAQLRRGQVADMTHGGDYLIAGSEIFLIVFAFAGDSTITKVDISFAPLFKFFVSFPCAQTHEIFKLQLGHRADNLPRRKSGLCRYLVCKQRFFSH